MFEELEEILEEESSVCLIKMRSDEKMKIPMTVLFSGSLGFQVVSALLEKFSQDFSLVPTHIVISIPLISRSLLQVGDGDLEDESQISLDPEAFQALVASNSFLVHASFQGAFRDGISLEAVQSAVQSGTLPLAVLSPESVNPLIISRPQTLLRFKR